MLSLFTVKIHIVTNFPSPNNEFLICCLEFGAEASISAFILACNAAYFALLASIFAFASSLSFKSEVLFPLGCFLLHK
jgi:hypothetical protein